MIPVFYSRPGLCRPSAADTRPPPVTAVRPAPDFDTVVLAGGRASRMGGVDKAGLTVGAAPMLVSVAQAAAAAGTSRLIVVGPARTGSVGDGLAALAAERIGWLTCVQEEPPGSGPVAGLRRGLAEATAPWLVLLAADLPFLTAAHIGGLLAAGQRLARDPDVGEGIAATDQMGRAQWLTSCWRTGSLRSALADYADDSLRGVLAPLNPTTIRLDATAGDPPPWLDCDTPDDLANARRAWPARAEDPGG
jgi:molybdopterin-guanine dinucleotide biosynthesis protein A